MKPLAVRDLASFVFRHGDLYPSGEGRSVEAWEGTAAHAAMQKARIAADSHYAKEVSLKVPVRLVDEDWQLQGRIDGLTQNDSGVQVVEEYKTSRRSQPTLRAADEAQAWLYAGMLCQRDLDISRVCARVIYLTPQGNVSRVFEHTLTRSHALLFLAFVLNCYNAFLQRIAARAKERRAWAVDLSFPHDHFRKNQRAMAGQVYKTVVEGNNLLLEAATGSGKTLAVLFPAFKAQAQDEQFFFLTSRNRGADAAINAAQLIAAEDAPLRVVQITAKEKTCPQSEMVCDAAVCPNAAGYYTRLSKALTALESSSIADRHMIESVAAEHSLCPFELSLDSAMTADLIIGDYNYVFDPSVRLQRFAYQTQRSLLIDEAHQLSNRVSDMLSIELRLSDVVAALDHAPLEIAESLAKLRVVMESLRDNAQSWRGTQVALGDTSALTTALQELLLCCDIAMGATQPTVRSPKPQTDSLFGVDEAEPSALLEEFGRSSAENANKLLPENLLALYFAALRWLRSQQWTDEEHYCHVLEKPRVAGQPHNPDARRMVHGQGISIHRRCIDSSTYASRIMNECRCVVRFSGTVSPLSLYQRLHGQIPIDQDVAEQKSMAVRAQAPFRSDQVKVLTVTDIDTRYQRRLQSLPQLCGLIADLQRARQGRYLVALPSYEYLDHLSRSPDKPVDFIAQSPGMDEGEQLALLEQFQQRPAAVLAIVMGGVFAESVDLGTSAVAGVVVVSLGLPPTNLIRSISVEYFNGTHGMGWGEQIAYLQPAMTRVVQAAGRLIRGPEDKGVICLVDPRFADPAIAKFFPEHWQPEKMSANRVESCLKTFWSNDLSWPED
ncbi:MAG: DEAD/DEAH box helicase [Pseudomonadales bacterium]|nr:DEAD/DEAH box helicase [Pseudomonadales bacterium]